MAVEHLAEICLHLMGKVDLDNAISVADQTKGHAYDAYFLDCGVRHAAPLLSLDRGLKSVALKLGVKLMVV